MSFFRKHTDVFILILLAIVSRLPYLLSPDLMLDGDESIVGLMSKHFVEGKTVPFFFYGQSYGFSFIEVLFISGGYLLAGISDYVVKSSVFALWLIAVVFFYKTALNICKGNRPAAMIMVLILILMPGWLLWSMKARGGYITAFTVSNIILYICLNNDRERMKWLAVGALCVVVFYAQPLWLAGLLPFVLYAIIRDRELQKTILFFIGIASTLLIFQGLLPAAENTWRPTVLSLPSLNSVSVLGNSIYAGLGGHYYLMDSFQNPLLVTVFAWVFISSMLASLIYFAITWRKNDLIKITALASVGCTLFSLLFIDMSSIRYALPLAGYMLLFMSIVWSDSIMNLKVFLPAFVLIVAGVFSLSKFDRQIHNQQSKADLLSCIKALETAGITHVFCNGPLEQWDIAFYSHERVIARYFYLTDRYTAYIHAVDSVYRKAPEKTALLGLGYGGKDKGAIQVNSRFYFIPQPDSALLKQMSFELQ